MIRLISKRRLAFTNRDDGTFLTVMPNVFETCPDWIRKDPLFGWAVNDGTIKLVDDLPIVQVNKPVEAVQEEQAAPVTVKTRRGRSK